MHHCVRDKCRKRCFTGSEPRPHLPAPAPAENGRPAAPRPRPAGPPAVVPVFACLFKADHSDGCAALPCGGFKVNFWDHVGCWVPFLLLTGPPPLGRRPGVSPSVNRPIISSLRYAFSVYVPDTCSGHMSRLSASQPLPPACMVTAKWVRGSGARPGWPLSASELGSCCRYCSHPTECLVAATRRPPFHATSASDSSS